MLGVRVLCDCNRFPPSHSCFLPAPWSCQTSSSTSCRTRPRCGTVSWSACGQPWATRRTCQTSCRPSPPRTWYCTCRPPCTWASGPSSGISAPWWVPVRTCVRACTVLHECRVVQHACVSRVSFLWPEPCAACARPSRGSAFVCECCAHTLLQLLLLLARVHVSPMVAVLLTTDGRGELNVFLARSPPPFLSFPACSRPYLGPLPWRPPPPGLALGLCPTLRRTRPVPRRSWTLSPRPWTTCRTP
jgi:hypothetical protein